MPTFIKPKFVHVEPGGGSNVGGLIIGGVVVGGVLAAVGAALRWLTEPHPALETALYTVFGIGVAGGVGVLAWVILRLPKNYLADHAPVMARPAQERLPASRVELAVTQVVNVITPAARENPATAALAAEVTALRAQVAHAAARPAEQHLHLHGVDAADVIPIDMMRPDFWEIIDAEPPPHAERRTQRAVPATLPVAAQPVAKEDRRT